MRTDFSGVRGVRDHMKPFGKNRNKGQEEVRVTERNGKQ